MAVSVVAAGSKVPFQEGLGEKVGEDKQCIVAPYVQYGEFIFLLGIALKLGIAFNTIQ